MPDQLPSNDQNSKDLNNVLKLLTQKQENPQNSETCESFYSSAYNFLTLNSISHWWCNSNTREIVLDMLDLFSMEETSHSINFKSMLAEQLSFCTNCVIYYHDSRDTLKDRYKQIYEIDSVCEFFNKLEDWDLHRILNSFSNFTDTEKEKILTSIFESLKIPGFLLKHESLYTSLSQLLEKLISLNQPPKIKSNILFGLAPLLSSGSLAVQKWAKKTLKHSQGYFSISDYNNGINYIIKVIIEDILSSQSNTQSISPISVSLSFPINSSWHLAREIKWHILCLLLEKIQNNIAEHVTEEFPDLILAIINGILYEQNDQGYVLMCFKWALKYFDPLLFWNKVGSLLKLVPSDLVHTIMNSGYSKALLKYQNSLVLKADIEPKDLTSELCTSISRKFKGLFDWIYPMLNSLHVFSDSSEPSLTSSVFAINLILEFLLILSQDSLNIGISVFIKSVLFSININIFMKTMEIFSNVKQLETGNSFKSTLIFISDVAMGKIDLSESEYVVSLSESLVKSVLLSDLDILYISKIGNNETFYKQINLDDLYLKKYLWLQITVSPTNIELAKISLFSSANLFLIDSEFQNKPENSFSNLNELNSEKQLVPKSFKTELSTQLQKYMIEIASSLENNYNQDGIDFEKSILQSLLRFLIVNDYFLAVSSSLILNNANSTIIKGSDSSHFLQGEDGVIFNAAKTVSNKYPILGFTEILFLLDEWNQLYKNNLRLIQCLYNIGWLILGFISTLPAYSDLTRIQEEHNILLVKDSDASSSVFDLNDSIQTLYSWFKFPLQYIYEGKLEVKVSKIQNPSEDIANVDTYATESVLHSLNSLILFHTPYNSTFLEIVNNLFLLGSQWPHLKSLIGSENIYLTLLLNSIKRLGEYKNTEINSNYIKKFLNSPLYKQKNYSKLISEISEQLSLSFSENLDISDIKVQCSNGISVFPNDKPVKIDLTSDGPDILDDLDETELTNLLDSLDDILNGGLQKKKSPTVKSEDIVVKTEPLSPQNSSKIDTKTDDNLNQDISIHLHPDNLTKKSRHLISDWFPRSSESSETKYDEFLKKDIMLSRNYRPLDVFYKTSTTPTPIPKNDYAKKSSAVSKKELGSQVLYNPYSSLSKIINTQPKSSYKFNPTTSKKFSFSNAQKNYSYGNNDNLRTNFNSYSRNKPPTNNKSSNFTFDNIDNVVTFSKDDFKVNMSSAGVSYISSSSSDYDSSDLDDMSRSRGGLGSLLDNKEKLKNTKNKAFDKGSKRSILFEKNIFGNPTHGSGLVRPNIQLSEAQKKLRDEELMMRRLSPNLNSLHRTILSWDIQDLNTIPSSLKANMKNIPKTFNSVEEYTKIFEPMLISECWAQLQRSIEDTLDSSTLSVKVDSRVSIDGFSDITFVMSSLDSAFLAEHDLVILINKQKGKKIANHLKDSSSSKKNAFSEELLKKRFKESVKFLAKVNSITSKKEVSYLSIRTVLENRTIPNYGHLSNLIILNSEWELLRLNSLVTIHREYSSLKSLQYLPPTLLNNILKPNIDPIKPSSEMEIRDIMRTNNINKPQAQAIISSCDRLGFNLIQGPPGTGKTKTILAIISNLLSSKNQSQKNFKSSADSFQDKIFEKSPGKILVCAPSNAAVDEVVFRLKLGIYNSRGEKWHPKIIRLGQSDSIGSSVKEMSLDYLVEKALEKAGYSSELINNMSSNPPSHSTELIRVEKEFQDSVSDQKAIKKNYDAVCAEREKLRAIERSGESSKTLHEIKSLQERINTLSRAKNTLSKQLNGLFDKTSLLFKNVEALKKKLRGQILSSADIICCTLSSSGHEIMSFMARQFETVIIDEASQAVELSCIIPLRYAPKRCILVGDPNQLPPTVLSRDATNFGYERSLFVRIQENRPESVHLLSIQYRMHPEISMFPSKLFYNNRLKDGPNMGLLMKSVWHKNPIFSPFRFFGIKGSEKVGRGNSLYNSEEISAISGLVSKLISEFPLESFYGRIGIITPYKQQLFELKKFFCSVYTRKVLEAIDFNTVDGFQGQEKDIIIFSCVRTNSANIGFLSDLRRMNVALTRARCSMFVFADPRAMSVNDKWELLLENARIRNCYTDENVVKRIVSGSKNMLPRKSLENLLQKSTKNSESEISSERDLSIENSNKVPQSNNTNSRSDKLEDSIYNQNDSKETHGRFLHDINNSPLSKRGSFLDSEDIPIGTKERLYRNSKDSQFNVDPELESQDAKKIRTNQGFDRNTTSISTLRNDKLDVNFKDKKKNRQAPTFKDENFDYTNQGRKLNDISRKNQLNFFENTIGNFTSNTKGLNYAEENNMSGFEPELQSKANSTKRFGSIRNTENCTSYENPTKSGEDTGSNDFQNTKGHRSSSPSNTRVDSKSNYFPSRSENSDIPELSRVYSKDRNGYKQHDVLNIQEKIDLICAKTVPGTTPETYNNLDRSSNIPSNSGIKQSSKKNRDKADTEYNNAHESISYKVSNRDGFKGCSRDREKESDKKLYPRHQDHKKYTNQDGKRENKGKSKKKGNNKGLSKTKESDISKVKVDNSKEFKMKQNRGGHMGNNTSRKNNCNQNLIDYQGGKGDPKAHTIYDTNPNSDLGLRFDQSNYRNEKEGNKARSKRPYDSSHFAFPQKKHKFDSHSNCINNNYSARGDRLSESTNVDYKEDNFEFKNNKLHSKSKHYPATNISVASPQNNHPIYNLEPGSELYNQKSRYNNNENGESDFRSKIIRLSKDESHNSKNNSSKFIQKKRSAKTIESNSIIIDDFEHQATLFLPRLPDDGLTLNDTNNTLLNTMTLYMHESISFKLYATINNYKVSVLLYTGLQITSMTTAIAVTVVTIN
ncbi:hypothetical protein BB560_002818 [Smittium megazygosporum]|uniref:UvrD-like helicase ATP-binding domain-containing protein n=1 Tax=Smittium megazygosporum TaxID=133381 RepID=A0A2T9ZDP7_9FUNG|nr:hypothetical protein BB560_002818 [Smittium megazygosporum]